MLRKWGLIQVRQLSFVDRDMVMRHFGGGIGHLRNAPPQTKLKNVSETMDTDSDSGSEMPERVTLNTDNRRPSTPGSESESDSASSSSEDSQEEEEEEEEQSDEEEDWDLGYATS